MGIRSPVSSVLSRHCDFLPSFPPHFVSFAWRYHGNTLASLPPPLRVSATGLGLGHPAPLPGFLPWRRQELPSSWGTPIPVCSCSSTPAGRCVPDHNGTLAWPPLRERRRRRRRKSFEAQWHGFRAGCLRITWRLPAEPRKARFRPLVRPYRTGFHPQGSNKGFNSLHVGYPPFPSFLAQSPEYPGIPGIPNTRNTGIPPQCEYIVRQLRVNNHLRQQVGESVIDTRQTVIDIPPVLRLRRGLLNSVRPVC
jgi:hypothetical protein